MVLHFARYGKCSNWNIFGIIPMGVFIQPPVAIIFIVCAFAETNKAPFDLAEGEKIVMVIIQNIVL